MRVFLRPVLLSALFLFPSVQASGGSFSLLASWKNAGHTPIALSPDGKQVAVTVTNDLGYRSNIAGYDAVKFKLLYRAMSANNIDAPILMFSPDGQTLWSAHTGTVHYDARSGKSLSNRVGSDGPGVSALAFSPDGQTYVLAAVNTVNSYSMGLVNTLTGKGIWSGTPYPPTEAESERANWVHSLAFSSDGSLVASGSGGGGVVVRDAQTGKRLRHLTDRQEGATPAMKKGWTAHADTVTELHFLSHTRLLSASRDGRLKLWNAATGELLARLQLDGGLLAAEVTSDGRVLAATGRGLVLIGTRKDEFRLLETLWSASDNPFTDVSVSRKEGKIFHVWLMARNGTLSHWLLM